MTRVEKSEEFFFIFLNGPLSGFVAEMDPCDWIDETGGGTLDRNIQMLREILLRDVTAMGYK